MTILKRWDGTQWVPVAGTIAGGSGGSGGSGGNDPRVLTYGANVGTGAAGPYTVTHNLGTKAIIAVITRNGSPYDDVDARILRPSKNAIVIDTTDTWAVDEYHIDIVGVLGTSDTTAPSVPTVTAGTPTTSSVTLTPSGSTDDVGVVGYNWFRDGAYVATTYAASPNYTPTGLSGGPFVFKATAVDKAGNESAQSAGTTVTLAANASPPAFVQAVSNTGANAASVDRPITFGTGPNRVGLAFVTLSHAGWQPASGITDTLVSSVDGAWTKLGVVDNQPSGQETGQTYVYAKLNPTSGAQTLTATVGKSGMTNAQTQVHVLEYINVGSVVGFTGQAYTSGANPQAASLTVPSAVNDLNVAAIGFEGSAPVNAGTTSRSTAGSQLNGFPDYVAVFEKAGAATSVTFTTTNTSTGINAAGVRLVKA